MTDNDDNFGRIDTLGLYQPFLERVSMVIGACQKRGVYFVATCGLRTYDEQNAIYAKGRTAPGGIVTNAKGGQSLHNFGIAVDFCRDANYPSKEGLKPDYTDSHYAILGEEAAKLGLEWGGGWKSIKDTPHVQLPYNLKFGIKLSDLRREYSKGGYAAVYKFLDQYKWFDD